jgi:hypothetical protein
MPRNPNTYRAARRVQAKLQRAAVKIMPTTKEVMIREGRERLEPLSEFMVKIKPAG